MADDPAPRLTVQGLTLGAKSKTKIPKKPEQESTTRSFNTNKTNKQHPNYLGPASAGAEASQDMHSKISHFSRVLSSGGRTNDKIDNEKHLQDLNKKFKFEEAREKVTKALKNAATPDGLVAINIKRLTFFNTDKIQRLLTKARAADEALTLKRVQRIANDELRSKRTHTDGLGRRLLAIENYVLPLPEISEKAEETGFDEDTAGLTSQGQSVASNHSSIGNSVSRASRGPMATRLTASRPGEDEKSGRASVMTQRSTPSSKKKSIKGSSSPRRRKGGDLDNLSLTDFIGPEKGWYETNPRIYFAIRTPLAQKTTTVFVLPSTSDEDLMIEALVHFTCNINPLKESSENVITIAIVAYMPTEDFKHYIVSEKHFYLIDIIRSICVADSYKFKSIIGDQLIAEADMEMCFGYGMFGYGYSNQLLNAGKPISEGVARSIFIRADPGPETEKVKEVKCVESRTKGHAALAPQVTHPSYLDYRNKLEIHDASAICEKLDGSDRPSDLEVAASVRPPVITLNNDEESRVRKMLQQTSLSTWKNHFDTITDRRERLVYLRSIILNEPECYEAQHIKGLKPVDDEPSTVKDNMSKFNEIHNVKICNVKNMAGLKIKPEKAT